MSTADLSIDSVVLQERMLAATPTAFFTARRDTPGGTGAPAPTSSATTRARPREAALRT